MPYVKPSEIYKETFGVLFINKLFGLRIHSQRFIGRWGRQLCKPLRGYKNPRKISLLYNHEFKRVLRI